MSREATSTEMTAGRLKISDIARLAGVSASAVSAAINHRPQISEATRERVLAVIRQYNYVPQSSARALSGKRNYHLGFLVSSKVTLGLANSYFSTMLAGVHNVCQQLGYHLVVSTYDLSSIKCFIMPPNIQQRSVDALVVAGITDLQVLKELQSSDIPFIIIGGDYPPEVFCLKRDVSRSVRRAFEYLRWLGHSNIYIPYHYENTRRDYLSAVADAPELVATLHFEFFPGLDEFGEGEMLAERWCRTPEPERFTALMANDQFATGFLRALLRNNYRCPEDVSVIAPESILSSRGLIPLTAIDDQNYQLGELATRLILGLVGNTMNENEIRRQLQAAYREAELVIRHSTGRVPAWSEKKL